MPCPQAQHSPKHQPGRGHILGPPPLPGWPCPESPQEMRAALHVHVLQWAVSPWPPFWRLLSSQGGDGQRVQRVQAGTSGYSGYSRYRRYSRAWPRWQLKQSRHRSAAEEEEGELCLPRVPVPQLMGRAPTLQSLTHRTQACPRSLPSRHSTGIFVYPRAWLLTHNRTKSNASFAQVNLL